MVSFGDFGTLSRDDCLDLLSRGGVGHVAFTFRALPTIAPVRYAFDGDALRLSLPRRLSIAGAVAGSIIAFQSQGFDEDHLSSWTVVAIGPASAVTEPQQDAAPAESVARADLLLLPRILTGDWIDFG